MKMETEYSTLIIHEPPDSNKAMIIIPYDDDIPVYSKNVRNVFNKENKIILTHIPSKKGCGDGKCMYFFKYHDDIILEISTLRKDKYRLLQEKSSKSDLSDIKIPVELISSTEQLRFKAEYLEKRLKHLYKLDRTKNKNGQNEDW